MANESIEDQLLNKGADQQQIAEDVINDPQRVDELINGLQHKKPTVKYGCGKALRIIADDRPDLLYPHFKAFTAMLDDENNIMQWEAIYVIGNLARMDRNGKITRILDHFLRPIKGPVMITAANTIGASAKIAKAKPQLADRIVDAILGVEQATYKTAECRNVAIGHAIESLGEIFDRANDQDQIIRFVQRQLDNSRPATRKKAERFLKKHGRAGAMT